MYSVIDILKALNEHRQEIYHVVGPAWSDFYRDLKNILEQCVRMTDQREFKKAAEAVREICYRYTAVKDILLNDVARNDSRKNDDRSIFEIRKEVQSLLQALEKDAPENVHFTLFVPGESVASRWYTALVYIHLESILGRVREDARKFVDEMGDAPHMTTGRKAVRLARGTEIKIILSAEGVEFNPPHVIIKWNEDMERAAFRFRSTSHELMGQPCFGEMEAYVGPLLVASLRFSVFFTDPASEKAPKLKTGLCDNSVGMYQKIFASYSHKDTDIVKKCTQAYKALGDDVLIDYETIRSGERWEESLRQMIDQADIFQLFWSSHSALSEQVTKEWELALSVSIKRAQEAGFIRPVFWEKPMPQVPPKLAHVHFKYVPDF